MGWLCGRSLCVATLFCFVGTLTAQPNYLPLVPGNTWTLSFGPAWAELTVTEVTYVNGTARATVSYNDGNKQFNFLLRTTSAGILLEGLEYPSIRSGFLEPEILFGSGGPGQTWVSPHLNVTLVADDQTISTPIGVFSNVRRYDVLIGGTAQTWYLAADVGFVQLGDTVGLALSKLVLKPNVPRTAPLPAACPAIGITANPVVNGDFSSGGKESVLRQTVNTGANLSTVSATWADLEKQRNVYDLSSIADEIQWAEKYNLKTVLIIKTIDSSLRTIPDDLQGLSWNDPRLMRRWKALVRKVVDSLNSHVMWIDFGNEVDLYLTARPGEIQPYSEFVAAAQRVTSLLNPSLSTGLTFAFDLWHGNNFVFQALQPQLQHIGFTYYALNTSALGSTHRDSANIPFDVADMIHAAGGRPLILTEVGDSSSMDVGSSIDLQKLFYQAAFTAFAHSGGTLSGANFSFLSDFGDSVVNELAITYINPAPSWASWLSQLGVFDTAGQAKPAWSVFIEQAANFKTNSSCVTGY